MPGIKFDLSNQVRTLASLAGTGGPDEQGFDFDNRNFGRGDAEIWFHLIRHFKPGKIVEIGSGYSTRVATMAVDENKREDSTYSCRHICIEPYEMPWLEELGIEIIRKKLEDVDLGMIYDLKENDILFIDSSHMIRPQGEVLLEILQILPRLAAGVIVHVHDIFTPRDYPLEWIGQPRFWNEQYLLEAFLTHNSAWEVLLAVNMLKHESYDVLKAVCPELTLAQEPGSFYLRRVAEGQRAA